MIAMEMYPATKMIAEAVSNAPMVIRKPKNIIVCICLFTFTYTKNHAISFIQKKKFAKKIKIVNFVVSIAHAHYNYRNVKAQSY